MASSVVALSKLRRLERIVHSKVKIQSFTRPHVILNLYDYVSSTEHKKKDIRQNDSLSLYGKKDAVKVKHLFCSTEKKK